MQRPHRKAGKKPSPALRKARAEIAALKNLGKIRDRRLQTAEDNYADLREVVLMWDAEIAHVLGEDNALRLKTPSRVVHPRQVLHRLAIDIPSSSRRVHPTERFDVESVHVENVARLVCEMQERPSMIDPLSRCVRFYCINGVTEEVQYVVSQTMLDRVGLGRTAYDLAADGYKSIAKALVKPETMKRR